MCEISRKQRLQILLRYTAIKNGNSTETVSKLCEEFNVSRNMPAKILKTAKNEGTLTSKSRTGRPSIVSSHTMKKRIVDVKNGSQAAVSLHSNVVHHHQQHFE